MQTFYSADLFLFASFYGLSGGAEVCNGRCQQYADIEGEAEAGPIIPYFLKIIIFRLLSESRQWREDRK